MNAFDLAVVGAGPAGSAAAITAANRGLKVLLLEAGQYPRHKVCGEFVSAESAEILRYLLENDSLFAAPRITTAKLHSGTTSCTIPLASPGYSIPRIVLDDVLWRCAQSHGIECRIESVAEVVRGNDEFRIKTTSSDYRARSVVNASGRWSRLSRRISKGQPWIGLKAHFAGPTDDAVDLYFLKNGYCGVQMVEPGILNACALVRQGSAKDLADVFAADPQLAARSENWRQTTQLFATAPVYLGPGSPVIDGMLQAGDAAGFVDPFVGDGISLALRSGVLAGRCAAAVSPAVYAQLYREAFGNIFRSTNGIRTLQAFSVPLYRWILRGLAIPSVAHRLFHQTRHSRLDVLASPLEPAEP
jgi:flavin-dependent dehydrogenase